MATTKASQKAVNKYVKNNYDRINVTMEKGKKERLKAHAEKYDKGSVNAFINRAIEETMERDNKSDLEAIPENIDREKVNTVTQKEDA